MFTFRPNSCDHNVFRAINEFNEYKLPDRFGPDDVILDIGAHIGSFAYACLQRGAGRVIAFEAEPENCRLAARHLAEFGDRVEVVFGAVWRSDSSAGQLAHSGYTIHRGALNTGGGNVIFQDVAAPPERAPILVPAISFDSVLNRFPRVRLAKLDCEGSEWPILLTSRLLGRVSVLCGEYHEIGGPLDGATVPPLARVNGYERFTRAELENFLRSRFERQRVSPHQSDPRLGLFWAENPTAGQNPQRGPAAMDTLPFRSVS